MARLDDGELEQERLLVEQAQRDRRTFGALYDRYVEGVYRFAYRRLGDHAAAEDLTAQVFERALERLPCYEWRGLPFGAWLYRIAANLLTDGARRDGRAVSLEGEEPVAAGGEAAEDAVIQREELDAAWLAVSRLPLMQRRAVTLYFTRGLSHREAGRIIGRSEAATKQLVYRAIQTLRSELQDADGGLE